MALEELYICLFVCLFVCPQHKSETNDPKVFKLGIGNDLGIFYKWYGLGLKGQRSTLGLELTAIRRGFALYECLLVFNRNVKLKLLCAMQRGYPSLTPTGGLTLLLAGVAAVCASNRHSENVADRV